MGLSLDRMYPYLKRASILKLDEILVHVNFRCAMDGVCDIGLKGNFGRGSLKNGGDSRRKVTRSRNPYQKHDEKDVHAHTCWCRAISRKCDTKRVVYSGHDEYTQACSFIKSYIQVVAVFMQLHTCPARRKMTRECKCLQQLWNVTRFFVNI